MEGRSINGLIKPIEDLRGSSKPIEIGVVGYEEQTTYEKIRI